jgi:hypothetical protein
MQKGFVVKSHFENYKGFFVVCKDDIESPEGTVPVVVIDVEQWERLIGVINTADKLYDTAITKTFNKIFKLEGRG